MKEKIVFISILAMGLGISYAYAALPNENMPSLAKEIKSALPDLFGTEGR